MSTLDEVVGGPARRLLTRAGISAWAFVGLVAAAGIVLALLGAVSSVALPLLFAAVLAVLFRPTVARLE
jgi:putative heme transporter